MDFQKIIDNDKHDKPSKFLKYGTAGFRDKAIIMDSVLFRSGVFATLVSVSKSVKNNNDLKCMGLMITASHNSGEDNGCKIADINGGMLSSEWEPIAEELINTDNLLSCLEKHFSDININNNSMKPKIILGYDTRESSERLAAEARQGILLAGGDVIELGLVTTPQLHFATKYANDNNSNNNKLIGSILLDAYYDTISSGYHTLMSTINDNDSKDDDVIIDASYGVGSLGATAIMKKIPNIKVHIRNNAFDGPVNEGCGAEYVQKTQNPPCSFDDTHDTDCKLCSFDGDADRIVFHYFSSKENKWILLDGDKIASLISVLLRQEIDKSGLSEQISFGIIQTAYANGSSTKYLKSIGVPIEMAKTGVKYLHRAAEKYDAGVYFEANGHGTVLFSEKYLQLLETAKATSERMELALKRLKGVAEVINQAIGDAISDMLITMAALRILELDQNTWNDLYSDLPSKQMKVPVAADKKTKFIPSDDETYLIQPEHIQSSLKEEMSKYDQGRCFCRPSGTEDVVRIYAEAADEISANELANSCLNILESF